MSVLEDFCRSWQALCRLFLTFVWGFCTSSDSEFPSHLLSLLRYRQLNCQARQRKEHRDQTRVRQEKQTPNWTLRKTNNIRAGNYIALKLQQDIQQVYNRTRGSGRTLICGSSGQLILIAYISSCLKRDINLYVNIYKS